MTRAQLHWDGRLLELHTRREGLRTAVTVLSDSAPLAQGSGFGRVLLPLPGRPEAETPQVLVLAPVPGVLARALLLVPRPPGPDADARNDAGDANGLEDPPKGVQTALDLTRAERHRFEPAPGTFAARLRDFEDRYPRLWASRHVVLAIGRVVAALLGIAAFFQLLLAPVIQWLVDRLIRIDWPEIPWPDVDLPSIPWPDIDLPDVSLPGWLVAVLASAKFWVPILIAAVLAVREVRRKRKPSQGAPTTSADSRDDRPALDHASDDDIDNQRAADAHR